MNSTVYFKTKNNFSYYYDIKNLCLVNIHPVIETIRSLDESECSENNEMCLLSLYPDLSREDILYYIKKYEFLKSNGFFSSLNTEKYVTGRINGDVCSNVNSEPIGTCHETILKSVYQELKTGTFWRKTRDKVEPCNTCIYKYLCPSPSNYEIAIGKANLCRLK